MRYAFADSEMHTADDDQTTVTTEDIPDDDEETTLEKSKNRMKKDRQNAKKAREAAKSDMYKKLEEIAKDLHCKAVQQRLNSEDIGVADLAAKATEAAETERKAAALGTLNEALETVKTSLKGTTKGLESTPGTSRSKVTIALLR